VRPDPHEAKAFANLAANKEKDVKKTEMAKQLAEATG
jgi:hypothetical protein